MNVPTVELVTCEVPAPMLGAWEAVYRDYVASDRVDPNSVSDREVQANLSARVAVAWRRLAEAPGVEWWMRAAFLTASEAMERQARDWAGRHRRSA